MTAAAKSKTASKAANKKAAPKKAAPKKISDYDRFIAGVSRGQQVSIYNHRTNSTHSTRVVEITKSRIITQRDGSSDRNAYTLKGNGTGDTEGTTVIPFTISYYKRPRKNAKVVSITPAALRKSVQIAA